MSVWQTVGALRGAPEIKPPKSKSSRRDVPMPAEVIAALREHRRRQDQRRLVLGPAWRDHGLVFAAANGAPINPNNLDRDFDRWVAQADVPRIRIHDLRHTHVTLAIKQGGNIKAVSRRVGHANIAITLGTYAHVLPEQDVEVSAKVGAVLFGTTTGEHL